MTAGLLLEPVELPPEPIVGAAALFALDPAVAHLNHGSYGAVPLPVQAEQQRLRAEQERDPDGFFGTLPARVAAARTAVARALGIDPVRLALVNNVTEAVAVALDSVSLAPGEEILVTDHSYGVVARAAERRAAECGAVLRTVRLPLELAEPPDPQSALDGFAGLVLAAVGPRTRVVILDRVTSPTARAVATGPLLSALATRGVVTMVDAAHAPGMLPLAPEVALADFWFGNLHKWAFAPRPTALLAVGPAWGERIRPLTYSWEHERGFPAAVEWRGTCDYTAWLAAPGGPALLARLGPERVREHNERLARHGQWLLVERGGLRPLPGSVGVSMRAVRLPAGVAETEEAARGLVATVRQRLGARIAVRPWAGGGVLRISAQVYNRAAEYQALATGLAGLLKG
ncbi:aminotransferase class V-fold PLP-dependent enzyme [Kitasatospora sp. NPDC052896]|uniref:aminotransferase class V-fold PLP-dependent enzyme n=1 Tax=Kitasatospora sp. NPDC052896 TaxID=3364061 RepID=UPI0037C9555A